MNQKTETSKCSICASEMTIELSFLYCRHVFHQECIFDFFQNSQQKKCPLCREDIQAVFPLFYEYNTKEGDVRQMLDLYLIQSDWKQIEMIEQTQQENYLLEYNCNKEESIHYKRILKTLEFNHILIAEQKKTESLLAKQKRLANKTAKTLKSIQKQQLCLKEKEETLYTLKLQYT